MSSANSGESIPAARCCSRSVRAAGLSRRPSCQQSQHAGGKRVSLACRASETPGRLRGRIPATEAPGRSDEGTLAPPLAEPPRSSGGCCCSSSEESGAGPDGARRLLRRSQQLPQQSSKLGDQSRNRSITSGKRGPSTSDARFTYILHFPIHARTDFLRAGRGGGLLLWSSC